MIYYMETIIIKYYEKEYNIPIFLINNITCSNIYLEFGYLDWSEFSQYCINLFFKTINNYLANFQINNEDLFNDIKINENLFIEFIYFLNKYEFNKLKILFYLKYIEKYKTVIEKIKNYIFLQDFKTIFEIDIDRAYFLSRFNSPNIILKIPDITNINFDLNIYDENILNLVTYNILNLYLYLFKINNKTDILVFFEIIKNKKLKIYYLKENDNFNGNEFIYMNSFEGNFYEIIDSYIDKINKLNEKIHINKDFNKNIQYFQIKQNIFFKKELNNLIEYFLKCLLVNISNEYEIDKIRKTYNKFKNLKIFEDYDF